MVLLKVDGIDVSYEELQVIWDLSFEVHEGESYALLGPNGAGKTTTLKTISGILHPVSGSIEMEGNDITTFAPHEIVKEGIAHIPEGRNVFPKLTVLENLKAASYIKKARQQFDKSIERVFDLFPRLEERQDQLAGTLSGGERQMLAIGRGLMTGPKLLMLDEPSLGLAPNLVDKVFELLNRLKEEGYTMLIVEQNVAQTLEVIERGGVLEEGRITLSGSQEDLQDSEHVKKRYLSIS